MKNASSVRASESRIIAIGVNQSLFSRLRISMTGFFLMHTFEYQELVMIASISFLPSVVDLNISEDFYRILNNDQCTQHTTQNDDAPLLNFKFH